MGENIIRNTIITVLLFTAIMVGLGSVYYDNVIAYGPSGVNTMIVSNESIWQELGNSSPIKDANTTYGKSYELVLGQNDTWEDDFEQNMFRTTLQGGKSSTKSFSGAWYIIKTVALHLKLPPWVAWAFSSILLVFFLFAILKFFRTGAES